MKLRLKARPPTTSLGLPWFLVDGNEPLRKSLAWMVDLHESNVHTSANDSTNQWAHDRDPEVVITQREDLGAPASDAGEETRAEITRRVDSVARVHADAHAESHDQEAKSERGSHGTGRTVALVRDSVDTEQQHGCTDHLRVERRVVGDIVTWVSGKAALSCLPVRVNGVKVLPLHDPDDERAAKSAQDLRDHVPGRLPPWQTAIHTVCHCHSRV
ncbi:hypothetical protein DVH05_028489 [Phytophthora capsici]|nr:hypothetical protein DVH05_028489 [Phytophthora capsici]